ncbi:MAG: rhodanese-like domain-containing protein [Chitinophagaceae bacterium]|nr:rhodanese-like domain-containing protein [Chitinophagaceae bacterium]
MRTSVLKFFILLFAVSLSFSPAAHAQKEGKIITVDVLKFQKKIKNKNVQLIDVRTVQEYNEGHLKGATNYNVLDSTLQKNMDKLNKKKPVYVYCRSGVRSMRAAEALKKEGFKVFNMDGGITSWNEKQLPVEK